MNTLSPTAPATLPPGTRLDELEIKRVLGIGGFGIVYLAFDHSLERLVAFKEFMPSALAERRGQAVTVRTEADASMFALGMRSFVNEARLLARFDHPALVKVLRFWEANGTAYMTMPYYEGQTLRAARAAMGGAPGEGWLRAVAVPLLGALDVLHAERVFHRDIAPDNILLLPTGAPVLLDFGAARRVIGDQTQSLTAILKPSFAPIEQYGESTDMHQGAWTDLYALAAVLYFCISGRPPSTAPSRVLHDSVPKLLQARDGLRAADGSVYGEALLATIDAALALRPKARPQTADEFRAGLAGEWVPSVAQGKAGVQVDLSDAATVLQPTRLLHTSTGVPSDDVAPPGRLRTVIDSPPLQVPTSAQHLDPTSPTSFVADSRAKRPHLAGCVWALQYAAVAIVALLLGTALASTDLFESTVIVRARLFGGGGLNAADLARAGGQSGALFLVWMAAARTTRYLRDAQSRFSACHSLVTASAIIFVLSCAYVVLWPVMRPLMSGNSIAVYRWAFVMAILTAAVWLGVLLLRHAELLGDGLRQAVAWFKSAITTFRR